MLNVLSDSFGRQFHYLRLSVTDACNFRCAYCLPDGHVKLAGAEEHLSLEEIRRLVEAFASIGFWKIRLTGGEPTVRRDILEIARIVAAVPGIAQVALSTNGYRLAELAAPLRSAGVSALNVSLDSLDPERFRRITGVDRLGDVLAGLDAAFAAGFPWLKLNAVLLADLNDGELATFMDWVRDRPASVRFIELMQTGDNHGFFRRHHVSADGLRNQLGDLGWRARARKPGDGPAVEFEHPAHRGRIGLITPYAHGFCDSCNRLRVSSRGGLRLCLFADGEASLRPWLQADSQRDALLAEVRRLIGHKTASHSLLEGRSGNTRHFAAIGG